MNREFLESLYDRRRVVLGLLGDLQGVHDFIDDGYSSRVHDTKIHELKDRVQELDWLINLYWRTHNDGS